MGALTKQDIHFSIIGNDKSKDAVNKFQKNIDKTNNTLKNLRNTIIAAFSVREIVNAANVMIGVENRMNALTGSAEKTGIAMDHMRRIAADSRSDFDAVAMLYTRLALATEHLGATQRDVADATQTVANTFIIAGSHAQEANNSARQLAQGLASGALRGDELRSVMENNTILTKMLADGFKMTIGELREFGHAGKLTAEKVMPILIAGTKQTNDEIAKMPMTLGQAGVALRNNFQFMIGDIEKLSRSFSGISAVIGHFANNMDAILIPMLALVPVALVKIGIALKALTLIIMANPLTALAVGFVALLTTLYIFRNEFVHVFNILTQKTLPIVGLKIKLFAKKMYSSFHDFFLIPLKQGMAFVIDGILTKVNTAIEGVNKVLRFLEFDEIPTIDLIGDVSTEKNKAASDIAKIMSEIEEIAGKEIKKMKMPSIMDMLTGRDPNAPAGDDGSGFRELTKLEQFLKDAENGFSKFQTSIKTMQDELQGVFKKSYDGLTKLTMDFLEKGKASFKDYATSIVRELIRIAVQKLIIDRMFQNIGVSLGKAVDGIKYDRLTDGDTLFDENYDGGGYTGSGVRAGGLDGKGGFPAMLHPNETVIDHTKGQGMGATVNFNISTVDAAGFDQLLASRKGLITSIINNAMNNQGKMGVV
tara:strand:- start:1634 stop:3577 length:1944 start_codon:yes stop_codon:yes gene_type:complete